MVFDAHDRAFAYYTHCAAAAPIARFRDLVESYCPWLSWLQLDFVQLAFEMLFLQGSASAPGAHRRSARPTWQRLGQAEGNSLAEVEDA